MKDRIGARVSVIAPAYNEAAGLHDVVSGWVSYLAGAPAISAWEIVVCDDGSIDGTAAVLTELSAVHPEILAVHHRTNRGAAAALVSAMARSSHEWIVLIDSDGQFVLDDLELVIGNLVRDPAGRAYTGVRARKADGPLFRWGSSISGWVFNLLVGSRLRDVNSIFKVLPGDFARSTRLEAGGFNLSAEMTAAAIAAGLRWVEFPVSHRARERGVRSGSFARDAWRRAIFVLYLGLRAWMLRRGLLAAPARAVER